MLCKDVREFGLISDAEFRQRLKASGGSQPRIKEGASHHARRGKNAEAFLICMSDVLTRIPHRLLRA